MKARNCSTSVKRKKTIDLCLGTCDGLPHVTRQLELVLLLLEEGLQELAPPLLEEGLSKLASPLMTMSSALLLLEVGER